MAHLLAITVSLALLLVFLGVTAYEKKRGVRILSRGRETLDRRTLQVVETIRTIDPFDVAIRGSRRLLGHVFHDLASVAWRTVRILERVLASVVGKLRTMRHHEERTETNSHFVKSISFHKRTLRQPEEKEKGDKVE